MQSLQVDGRVERRIVSIDANLISPTLSISLPVNSATPIANLFKSPESQAEIQAAMQWWYQRRSHQSHRQADNIRDRLLQELFSLRRGLELAMLNPANSNQYQRWLEKVEELQRSLLTLSDQLSPPYSEASLPLALQYEVEQWKTQHPQIRFEVHTAHSWQHNSLEHNQLIVEVLGEWLNLNLSTCDQEREIAITLKHQDDCNTLILQANYLSQVVLEVTLESAELKHLRRVFELLMPGKTEVERQGQQAVWYFFWKGESHDLST